MKKRYKRYWWMLKHIFNSQPYCTLGLKCKAEKEKHFREFTHL